MLCTHPCRSNSWALGCPRRCTPCASPSCGRTHRRRQTAACSPTTGERSKTPPSLPPCSIRRRASWSTACFRRRWSTTSSSADRLSKANEVALAVVEERAELAGALARIVVRRCDHGAAGIEPGHLEAFQAQAAGAQLGDRRLEVVNLECHLRR